MTNIQADAVLDAPGIACVSLTPLVNKTIKSLPHGAVLEVRSDDPAAREGMPSWCRLTRNELIDTVEQDNNNCTFYIQRAPHPTLNEQGKATLCPPAS